MTLEPALEIADVLSGDARWALVHGDCHEVLPTLPGKSVDHVVTDPPYTAHVHGHMMSATTSLGIRTKKVTCDFDSIDSYTFVPGLLYVARRWVMAFCALEQLGSYKDACPKQWVRSGIYRKQRATPQFSGDRPGNSCEGIAIFHPQGRKSWNGGGTHAFWHPTAKPVELMAELIGLFTDPGDIILDPFAGSGTTGVAALRLGRRFIGIERDEKYAALARERLCAEEHGSTLQAARIGQIPMFGGAK